MFKDIHRLRDNQLIQVAKEGQLKIERQLRLAWDEIDQIWQVAVMNHATDSLYHDTKYVKLYSIVMQVNCFDNRLVKTPTLCDN